MNWTKKSSLAALYPAADAGGTLGVASVLGVPFNRSLAWKLNWYRQSELEGALLLGKMIKSTVDPWVAFQLTKHSTEEANHSFLWNQVINQLGLPIIRIFRTYQSFFLQQSRPPASLLEVLAFTQIFERRVHETFVRELKDPGTPNEARLAYAQMIEDEKGHLGWVAKWLKKQPSAPAMLQHYQEIDRTVFAILQPYQQRLWEIDSLGSEV